MHTPLIAVSAALFLVLGSTGSVAQEKSNAMTITKPTTTLTKSAKAANKSTTSQHAVTVKSTTGKDVSPAATQSTPISERSYEGCHHGHDSDV